MGEFPAKSSRVQPRHSSRKLQSPCHRAISAPRASYTPRLSALSSPFSSRTCVLKDLTFGIAVVFRPGTIVVLYVRSSSPAACCDPPSLVLPRLAHRRLLTWSSERNHGYQIPYQLGVFCPAGRSHHRRAAGTARLPRLSWIASTFYLYEQCYQDKHILSEGIWHHAHQRRPTIHM